MASPTPTAAPIPGPFDWGPAMWRAAWRSTLVLGLGAGLAAWSGQSLWWTLLAQTAATGVIGLGLALLMGQGGLIPFGQALFSGLGGLVVMHALQALHGVTGVGPAALPLLPMVGALAGALAAALAGALCARQAGLAFAMITLGLGELGHALAQMFPAWSGGEGGLRGDRVLGAPWRGLDFGSPAQIACLVMVYTVAAAVCVAAWPHTRWGLLLRAVRDQPERAAALGHEPARQRWLAFTAAGACAGLGGGLLALLFESASAEAMSGTRSASLMLFTYMGGTAGLAGPAIGAALLVFATVWLSVWTQAWSLYVGALFLVMVMSRPEGLGTALAGRWAGRRAHRGQAARWPGTAMARSRPWLSAMGAAMAAAGAVVAVEMIYHLSLSPDPTAPLRWIGLTMDPRAAAPWASSLGLLAVGLLLRHRARSPSTAESAEPAEPVDEGSDAVGPVAVLPPVPSPRPGPASADALILDDVHLRFGRTQVLRGARLQVRTGERLALIGPNGAGKTTLFELISGRLAPDAGQIHLAGRRIDGQAPPAIARAGLGRSHQVSRLFARLTVAEHLWCALLGAPAGSTRPEAAVEVGNWLATLSLAHRAATPAGALSHAEQRQLEIGLAAAGGAPVLLLDEPTAGMSRSETARCVDLIRRLSEGRTLVMVEHDMEVVFDLADRIAVLVDGCILAVDTPARIRADARVQQAYLGAAWRRAASDA